MAVAIALVTIHWTIVPSAILIGWFGVHLFVSACRLLLAWLYWRRQPGPSDNRPWLIYFAVGVLCSGFIWGAAGVILFSPQNPLYQAALMIAIAGIAAGAVTSLSVLWGMAAVFIVAVLVPLIVRYLMSDSELVMPIAGMMLLFLLAVMLLTRRLGKNISDNIYLRTKITARESEMRRERERYRTLVQSTSAILWEGDPTTFRFTFVSREAESLLGYPTERWLDEPSFWVDHMHPDDRDWAPGFCAKATAEKRQHDFDYRMISADGRAVWLRDYVSVVEEEDSPVKLVGVMIDITKTKNNEHSLEYLSGLQRTLVEVSTGFIDSGPEQLDKVIDDALAQTGSYCDVDRSYLFQFKNGLEYMDNTHEWCAPGIPPEIHNLQNLPRDGVPNVVAKMENREVMHIPQVAALDPEWTSERAMFDDEDIQSRVVVPIVAGGELLGFIGFDSVHRERNWHDEEIRLLKVLADIVGAIIQRDTAKKALQESEARYRSVVGNISEVVYQLDEQGLYTFLNPVWEEIMGFTIADTLGTHFLDYVHDDDAEYFREEYEQLVSGGRDANRIEIRYLTRERGIRRIEVDSRATTDANGRFSGCTGTLRDVTEQREAEQKIRYLAQYDGLTDLPNRTLALDRLDQLVKALPRSSGFVAVLYLDLDYFKKVNDTLGHEVGDHVLLETAKRLRNGLRSQDTVARLGGDEFLILVGGLTSTADVQPVVEMLLSRFREPFVANSREVTLTASIGVAVAPTDGKTFTDLLRNADMAMYQSKNAGRNTYHYFTESMNRDMARRLIVEQQLRGALRNDEFKVLFQPVIDLVEDRVIGAEALLRWRNPNLGSVEPEEFIPVAEQIGLIYSVGDYVLQEALKHATRWRAQYDPDFRVCVNVSPQQFQDRHLVERIERTLEKMGLSGDALEVEITEGVLFNGQALAEESLKALRNLGTRIAMDDFGTGYASLSYLRRYSFDTLKIDRSFVRDMIHDLNNRELVATSLRLARGLGLHAIAEGVENEEQLELLKGNGCQFAQGLLFSAPVEAEQFDALLSRSPTTIRQLQ